MLSRVARLLIKSVGPDGFALRSVANPADWTWYKSVFISNTHVTILDEKILRILREVRSVHDTDSWGTVSLERSRICLRISEPGQVYAVELDMFDSVVEGIVFGVCRIDGDLCLLDVTDDVEGSIGLSDAEGDGELTTGVGRMYCEGSIGRGYKDWSVGCVEGRS
jgi:hypothetical protein